jgi:hypothetical protein
MGREVRRVPKDWQHPKDKRGSYIPLLGGSFSERLAEWEQGNAKWSEGLRDDWHGGWKPIEDERKHLSFSEWDGERPQKEDYMPEWSEAERTHYQMYEACTEGTPISPVMVSPEELARWLVENKASAFADETASYESWLRVANGGFACSAVLINGTLKNAVDGLSELPE